MPIIIFAILVIFTFQTLSALGNISEDLEGHAKPLQTPTPKPALEKYLQQLNIVAKGLEENRDLKPNPSSDLLVAEGVLSKPRIPKPPPAPPTGPGTLMPRAPIFELYRKALEEYRRTVEELRETGEIDQRDYKSLLKGYEDGITSYKAGIPGNVQQELRLDRSRTQ